jgi:hypothetical protein
VHSHHVCLCYNRLNVKTERSWHRVAVACEAGAKAQVGASAEVVLMAAHHKRCARSCISWHCAHALHAIWQLAASTTPLKLAACSACSN